MRNYQESVTTEKTDIWTDRKRDTVQSGPYVPLCLAGNTKSQSTGHKVINPGVL